MSPAVSGQIAIGAGPMQGVHRSIRLHLILGLSVVVVLAGGLGGWAATQQISGALIAPGDESAFAHVQLLDAHAGPLNQGRAAAQTSQGCAPGRPEHRISASPKIRATSTRRHTNVEVVVLR